MVVIAIIATLWLQDYCCNTYAYSNVLQCLRCFSCRALEVQSTFSSDQPKMPIMPDFSYSHPAMLAMISGVTTSRETINIRDKFSIIGVVVLG